MGDWKDKKRFVDVMGRRMAYVEMGQGDPIIFLHGNPTSSYLWRNVMPYLKGQGRCIAPDLIGMGDSDRLKDVGPGSYRFAEHKSYIDGFLKAIVPDGKLTLVIHDWGSALGFDWARRHADRISSIAYMEAIVTPVTWGDWPDAARPVFQGFRSEMGEDMVLEKNIFIEKVFPGSIIRKLSDEEMTEYRRPFLNPGEDRRPTLTWPRELPIDGSPEDVVEIVEAYAKWMATNSIPKLFINAEPGAILIGRQREFARSWKNQTEVTVDGIHFIQEDAPDEIGRAVSDWHSDL